MVDVASYLDAEPVETADTVLCNLGGTAVTQDDVETVKAALFDVEMFFIDELGTDGEVSQDRLTTLTNRTFLIEDVVESCAIRNWTVSDRQAGVMRRVFRGRLPVDVAAVMLPRIPVQERKQETIEQMSADVQRAFRESMTVFFPEFQEVVRTDNDVSIVYCEQCDAEYEYTMSVLGLHNSRRHEYDPDTDYDEYTCAECGADGSFTGAASEGKGQIRACTECGAIQ